MVIIFRQILVCLSIAIEHKEMELESLLADPESAVAHESAHSVEKGSSMLFPYGQCENKLCGIISCPTGVGNKQRSLWVKVANIYDS